MPLETLRIIVCRAATMAAIVCGITAPALAQGAGRNDQRRAQVAAATQNAIDSLRDQVSAMQIRQNLTVKTFLDQTGLHNNLNKTLARAQLIGGPRTLGDDDDDGTTQVRLEISGTRVANALVQIAAARPDWSPIPPDELALALKHWSKLTFSAIGTSTGAAGAVNAVPPPGEQAAAWKTVDEATRRSAIAQAKADAVARVVSSVEPIALTDATTVREIFKSDPRTREELDGWLAARPVTRIDFRDDLDVELTLAARPEDAFDAFKGSIPADDKIDWSAARQQWVARMAAPVGIGRVPRQDSILASTMPRAIVIPARAPDWVTRQIEAEGVATAQSSKLKTARLAEADAADKLREQIGSLQLTRDISLGAAAREDPRIEEAIDRALAEARTAKADYRPDGSAAVRVVLNLRELWDELRRLH